MFGKLQLIPPSQREKALHLIYGHKDIEMVRGAGKLNNPDIMLVFMNPTARNISSNPKWKGLRAPWIGTKKVWQMLNQLSLIDSDSLNGICNLRPEEWSEDYAFQVYKHVADRGIYITNLASCTQPDARHLSNAIFREYLPVIHNEIYTINPSKIITFGNQISSILMQKSISVSDYHGKKSEVLETKERKFNVYPTYYPVGQGQRNMPKAIKRIKSVTTGSIFH
jgi:hypothetical protein